MSRAEISKKIIPGCIKAICALVETLTTASVSGVSVNGSNVFYVLGSKIKKLFEIMRTLYL